MSRPINLYIQDTGINHVINDDTPVSTLPRPADKKPQTASADKDLNKTTTSTLATAIQYTQTQVIPVDPQVMRDNKLAAFFEDLPATEQYKILRTQIFHKITGQQLNTIMVSSPGYGEGKSLTAANLAISLAKDAAHTALLVDTDFHTPGLQKLFGLTQKNGLADCLLRDIPLSEILVNPGINRLTLLPGSPNKLPEASEIAGSPKMAALIKEIKNRYDDRFIVFDAPPVLEKADALILSQLVDGVILVVEQGKTQKKHITKALDLLKNANLLGLVLNNKAGH